jgi:exonuclease III
MHTTIASLNVRGLANKTKREKILSWLKEQPFSIILLQETHSALDSNITWGKEWGKNVFLSGNSTNSKGVAILLKQELNATVIKHTDISTGCLQALELEINEKNIIVINIYGPNDDDATIFNKLDNFIAQNLDKTFVIGGDFNTVLNSTIDKKNGLKNTHPHIRRKLSSIMQTYSLVDIWRTLHPDKHQFTWHSNSKPTIFSRLDYFLISDNLVNFTNTSSIKPGFNTDHSLVKINLDFIKLDRGPGVFKLNNSILLDCEYQEKIKTAIQEITTINKDANPNTTWELIKGTIRNETIKFTSKKAKLEKEDESKLISEIKEIEKDIATNKDKDETEELVNSLKEKKTNLNEIIEHRIKGILVRSKADQIEFDEKNSKYFSNLEKKKSEQKLINKLNVNGETITDQSKIRQAQLHFYKNLYDKKQTQESQINFFNNNMKTLSNDDKNLCEGMLTEYECGMALKDMKNSKSPGSDGITTEFYKLFWNNIKTHFTRSVNFSYQTKQLTELQSQGLITLLPKPEKDLTLLSNWRPICLLNIDFKIATKAIANRIKKVLNTIIDSSQTGFIKGRYIGENVRLICEIMDYTDDTNNPGILFFSDFEKAFDTIDHDYMFQCLRHFKFGEDLINWIQLFYSNS